MPTPVLSLVRHVSLLRTERGRASCRTWFAKGRPDSPNGLSVIFFPGVELFILLRGVCEGGGGELVRTFELPR